MGFLVGFFRRTLLVPLIALAVLLVLAGCSSAKATRIMYIGGIPDQDISVLEQRFNGVADYLTQQIGLTVKYIPTTDYAAVVTGFRQGDIQMAWYGGLTGVQARLAVPHAQAIVQRPQDAQFTSVFIARQGLGVKSLADLKGKSFTFGSESSTSGHLMPRYFLTQAGVNPEKDLSRVNYSGSHDTTLKLVEAGTFQAGALNVDVWNSRVKDGKVDANKVEAFLTTQPYYDYHWVIRGDVDQKYGIGTSEKIRQAMLELNAANGGNHKQIMDAFQAQKFIITKNDSYKAIEDVARALGIIEQ